MTMVIMPMLVRLLLLLLLLTNSPVHH